MNTASTLIFVVSFAAIYYIRTKLLKGIRECTDPNDCLISVVTFMNVMSLSIIGMSLLFSSNCTGTVTAMSMGMFLNAQLLFVERLIAKHMS